MLTSVRIGFALCVLVACGDDSSSPTPDSPTGNHPPPRVIPGGGIGDGAIDGVVNLYVMDDATRAPLANATVRVGTQDGTTDATGLFVAQGVVGPQTVIAKLSGYRSEMWLGANGANMTMSLHVADDPTPARANILGSITGLDQLTVAAGHHKAAIVTYSNDEKAGDLANNIDTPNNANICDVLGTATSCNFAVVSRAGDVSLIAAIYDHDTKNTTVTTDDTFMPIGWAYKTGLTVVGGVNQTGVTLTTLATSDLTNVITDFGTPPASLSTVAGVVGIEVSATQTMQLVPTFATPNAPTVLAPALSAIPGAKYRFTAVANNGSDPLSAASFTLHRGETSTSLAAGTWLDVPASVTFTRTSASWAKVTGAAVQGAEVDIDKTHHLLSVTAFDGSTSVTIPDLVALPPTGTLLGRATALQGSVDLQNFSADDLMTKITGFSAQPVQID